MTDGFFEWLVGIVITILSGVGVVFFHIYGKIDILDRKVAELETRLRAEGQLMETSLDKKIELERETNRLHREGIIEKVASLPTKEDFQNMEARITRAIHSQTRG